MSERPNRDEANANENAAVAFARAHPTSFFDTGGDTVMIGLADELSEEAHAELAGHLESFRPWRKGPFEIFGQRIDANWDSHKKWSRVLRFADDLGDRRVCDVGCNNGYYMFRMLGQQPRRVIGLDPVGAFRDCFTFLNLFLGEQGRRLEFLERGFDWLAEAPEPFDVIFCMGIVYHHPDPIGILRLIHAALEKGGQLVLETQGLPGTGSNALFPAGKYAGVRGVWFLPTAECTINWLRRAGFRSIEFHEAHEYRDEHLRRPPWADIPGLAEGLDPEDPGRTIEGYPAPVRMLLSARR